MGIGIYMIQTIEMKVFNWLPKVKAEMGKEFMGMDTT